MQTGQSAPKKKVKVNSLIPNNIELDPPLTNYADCTKDEVLTLDESNVKDKTWDYIKQLKIIKVYINGNYKCLTIDNVVKHLKMSGVSKTQKLEVSNKKAGVLVIKAKELMIQGVDKNHIYQSLIKLAGSGKKIHEEIRSSCNGEKLRKGDKKGTVVSSIIKDERKEACNDKENLAIAAYDALLTALGEDPKDDGKIITFAVDVEDKTSDRLHENLGKMAAKKDSINPNKITGSKAISKHNDLLDKRDKALKADGKSGTQITDKLNSKDATFKKARTNQKYLKYKQKYLQLKAQYGL